THRPPPASPTRRSSDLFVGIARARDASAERAAKRRPAQRAAQLADVERVELQPEAHAQALAAAGGAQFEIQQPDFAAKHGQRGRSEEHTSELQSRENLV